MEARRTTGTLTLATMTSGHTWQENMTMNWRKHRSECVICSIRSYEPGTLIAPGSRKSPMRRIVTRLNEKRVHAWIVYDLFNLRLSACRTISTQRHTRPLAEVGQDVSDQETRTIPPKSIT